MGNNGYGGVLMDRSKHTKTSFAKKENLQKHMKNPFFKDHDELNHNIFEVTKQRSKIVHDLPIQLGLATYSYAKLRMLEFWKFLHTYLDQKLYQLMEMDTDSLYVAFARHTIDKCVKSEMCELWKDEKWKWFCVEDETRDVEFRDSIITRKEYDHRTPGKFKEEFGGVGIKIWN